MNRTTPQGSDFPAGEIACRHRWEGGQWHALPPKADGLMHAAGGLFTSPSDLATWLQANLGAAAGLPAALFRRARRPVVAAPAEDGPFSWTDYALGQQGGTIAGLKVFGHRGGYEGARSIAIVAPDAGVGLALAVNADFGTRELLDDIMRIFFDAFADRLS
jgi:CubicO group peptidase (beta-lactamase class C family)